MRSPARGVTAAVDEATVRAHVAGDVSGQLAVGEHINQVGSVHGDLVLQLTRPPTVEPRPRPLGRRPSSFPDLLGRESEVASAVAALESGRRIGFHGTRGVGKSSVLRHVAHLPTARLMPDGVLYCPGRRQSLADLLQVVFDGFYDAEMGFTPTAGQLRHYLSSLAGLLVIDDLDVGDEDVDVLVDSLPNCNLLLTSEKRCVWDSGRAVALHGLPEPAAVALIERELGRPLSPEEEEDARALSRALEGHPRRLMQAVASVSDRGRSLADVAAELATRAGDEPVVQQVTAGLTVQERDVLALVAAVDPAPLAADRVVAITGSPDSRAALATLRDKHLLTAHSPRFSSAVALLPEEHARRERWAAAALDHYLTVLHEGRGNPAHFEEDIEALRALASWAAQEQRWDDVVRLVRDADPVLAMARRWDARDQLVRQALAAARAAADRAAEAWCHHQLGTRALWLGELAAARSELTAALDLRRSLGDVQGAEVTQFHLDQLAGPPPPAPPSPTPAAPPPTGRRRIPLVIAVVAGFALLVLVGEIWRRPDHRQPITVVPVVGASDASVEVRPSTLTFEERDVGTTSSPKNITFTNKSRRFLAAPRTRVTGEASSDFAVVGGGCQGQVEAGRSCRIGVAFAPSTAGERHAILSVDADGAHVDVPLLGKGSRPDVDKTATTSRPPTSTSVRGTTTTSETTTSAAAGASGSLQAEPDHLSFGDVRLGAISSPAHVVLRNAGRASVKITSVAATGPAADDFTVSAPCQAATLAPARTCDVSVSFAPTASGTREATLAVTAEGIPTLLVALDGTGTSAHLELEPTSLDFGAVSVHSTSGPQVVRVTNTGTAPSTISTVTLDAPVGSFAMTDGCATTALDPGASCQVSVSFTPDAPGAFSGSLSIHADVGGVLTATLTGTGIAHADLAVVCSRCGAKMVFVVTNAGPDDARDARLTVTGSGPVTVSLPDPARCSGSGTRVVCDLGMIEARRDTLVALGVAWAGDASLTATVTASTDDPDSSNNTTTVPLVG